MIFFGRTCFRSSNISIHFFAFLFFQRYIDLLVSVYDDDMYDDMSEPDLIENMTYVLHLETPANFNASPPLKPASMYKITNNSM